MVMPHPAGKHDHAGILVGAGGGCPSPFDLSDFRVRPHSSSGVKRIYAGEHSLVCCQAGYYEGIDLKLVIEGVSSREEISGSCAHCGESCHGVGKFMDSENF